MDSEYHPVEQDSTYAEGQIPISERNTTMERLLPSTPGFEPLSLDFDRTSNRSANVSPVSRTFDSDIARSIQGDGLGDEDHHAAVSQYLFVDEDPPSDENEKLERSTKAPFYCPFFLQRSVLSFFAATCLAIIVAVGILYGISQHNQGLGSPSERLHLLWKYGLTAILVLVSALWGQVELRTKQLMPWKIMQSKAAPAKESILLDYVDPMSFVSLLRSFKASHWPVFLVIAGGMMLKLAIIFSSGFLDLNVVHIEQSSASIISTYQFDTKSYNISTIDGTAYANWYSIQRFNLSYPEGTASAHAYQFFNLSSPPKNFQLPGLSMSGVADQFSAEMTCQPLLTRLNFTYTFGKGQDFIPYEGAQVNLTGPQLGYYILDIASPSCNASLQVETELAGSMYLVSCSTGHTTNSWDGLGSPQTRNSSQDQVIFAFRGLVSNQTQLTAVLCQPKYNLGKLAIRLPYSNIITPPDLGLATSGKLPELSALDVLDAFRAAVAYPPPDLLQGFQNNPVGDFFFSVLNVTNYHSRTWLDPESLSQNISNIYSSFTAQLALRAFTVPSNSSIEGTIDGKSNRLMAQELSMGLIVASLTISMLIAIALVFIAPREATPRDPSTIGGLASILSRSPGTLQMMGGKGHLDCSSLLDHSSHSTYRSAVSFETDTPKFKVGAFQVGDKQPKSVPIQGIANINWWKPYSTTILNKLLILVLLSIFIVVLEILYRLSERRDGLASVPGNTYVKLAWSYVPVTAVVILGILLGGYDFTMRVLQPYLALQRGNAPAARGVLDDQLNRLATSRLWFAITTFQITVIASTTAVLLVHILTVAISGLYVAELKPQMVPNITISQLDVLDGSQLDSSFVIPSDWMDGGAVNINRSSLPGLVLDYNVPKPLWTTSNFTFPQVRVTTNQAVELSNSSSTGQTLQLTVPTLRGNINCSLLPDSQITFKGYGYAKTSQTTYGQPTPDAKGLVVQTPALKQCGDVNFNFTATQYGFKSGYVGQVRYGSTNEALMSSINTTCPQFVMVFGYIDPAITKNITNANISVAWCNPYYERVNVNVTYLLPNYTIQSAVSDESSVVVQTLPETWPITVQGFSDLPTSKSNGAGPTMSPFFQSLLMSGSDPLPLTSIGRKDKSTDVMASMATAYRILSAQTANIYLRSAPLSPPPKLSGSLSDSTRLRLVQSAIPTRIMQGVLAVLLLCMIVAFITSWTSDKVLAASPTNIAAVAILLAGARFVDDIPEGGEWSSDAELRQFGVFGKNESFSLRWWEEERGKEQRFGIDREGLRDD